QLVIGVAERYEYAQSPVRIHIDSPDFSLTDKPETLIPEPLLPVDKADLYEHNNLGIREGTDIFLALLVPNDIAAPGIRAIYFSRWRLDLQQKSTKTSLQTTMVLFTFFSRLVFRTLSFTITMHRLPTYRDGHFA